MIDIHCHLLYGVDDGADTIDTSIAMIDDAVSRGITDIILTPHYRRGMFVFDLETIRVNYEQLVKATEDRQVRLYLGCEYHVNSDMIEYMRQGRTITMADSDYVLTEYSYDSSAQLIRNNLDDLLSNGYIPVIAHAERYEVVEKDPGVLAQYRRMGALIQINADSIIGKDGFAMKKQCRKILKNDLADMVASDSHDMRDRKNHMPECMAYIIKKYGEEAAKKLFETNPRKIIEGTQRTIE